MNNAYQWLPFYEAVSHTDDINHLDPPRFTSNFSLGNGMLIIVRTNKVWMRKNGFCKCIKTTGPPLNWGVL